MVHVFWVLASLSAMAWSENRTWKQQLAHDLSSWVNTKLRVCLQLTASRCSSNLSDIVGMYVDKDFPLVERTTSHFYLHPSCHQSQKTTWCGFLQQKWDLQKQGAAVVPKPRLGTNHILCHNRPLLVLLLIRVPASLKITNWPRSSIYLEKKFKRCALHIKLKVDAKAAI